MALSSEAAAQLSVYAQVAVGFAGFAGVIGAFSHFRMHATATAFRVRAMVALALMEVIFSLLPLLVGGFGLTETGVWRVCAGVLAVVASVAVVVMARQASRLYRVGHLMRRAAYVLCVIAVGVVAPLYPIAFGLLDGYAAAGYFATLFFGMVVCAYHFLLLMIAVQLEESE